VNLCGVRAGLSRLQYSSADSRLQPDGIFGKPTFPGLAGERQTSRRRIIGALGGVDLIRELEGLALGSTMPLRMWGTVSVRAMHIVA
jgi:hypothetical protein